MHTGRTHRTARTVRRPGYVLGAPHRLTTDDRNRLRAVVLDVTAPRLSGWAAGVQAGEAHRMPHRRGEWTSEPDSGSGLSSGSGKSSAANAHA